MAHPLISVIMPVLNEAAHIQRTLACLRGQEASAFDLEFLLVDGGSNDGTLNILGSAACSDGRIRLLRNARGTTPAAFNIGIEAARGDYVAILGAHTWYPSNYIAICYSDLLRHGATGCSGRIETAAANGSLGARLSGWCLKHRFACSGSSVRTQASGFVETIPYPVFRKQALLETGGYDERLERNQDNDMNQRLRNRGHKLYLTPRTRAVYYARPGIRELFAYAYRTGRWNAVSLRYRPGSMSARHFVPFAFVLVLGTLLVTSLLQSSTGAPKFAAAALVAGVLLHLLIGTGAAIDTAVREHSLAALLLPAVICGFHLSYGAGTLAGFLDRRTWYPSPHANAVSQPAL